MQYLKVEWKHQNDDYPILLYSEINDERMETRKVEVFRDGSVGFADSSTTKGKTQLGIVPLPSIDEIAVEAEFVPVEISKNEFEGIWGEHAAD
ncbi:MAG: hypothetical protein R3C53_14950 [Pirellulaceae bacterium]